MPFRKVKGFPVYDGPGVYAVKNQRNGKVYVGSSGNIRGRLMSHRSALRIGTHDSHHLQHAWKKYGESIFTYEGLEACPRDCTREYLLDREDYWIDKLQSTDANKGYNLVRKPSAGGMNGCNHSEETKARW